MSSLCVGGLLRGGLIVGLALSLCGCATRQGRDYGNILFPGANYFQVQVVTPDASLASPVPIADLLLLPPVGDVPENLTDGLQLTLWQELQQILPGAVRAPRPRGRYVPYMQTSNILMDDGRPAIEELVRIGKLAQASHVLLPRIIDYRAYHPQRIVMEWLIVDVNRGRTLLLLVGGLDVSEQRVLISADSYLRERKAKPYNTANLELLLRSPREFNGFAVAQAVDALRGRLTPDKSDPFKRVMESAEVREYLSDLQ